MDTLENTISWAKKYESNPNVLLYLNMLRDVQILLKDKNIVDYLGHNPVIEINGKNFIVKEYVPEKKCWRCLRVDKVMFDRWSCCDDDNYIIDNNGNILYREVGWRLTEVPYEED